MQKHDGREHRSAVPHRSATAHSQAESALLEQICVLQNLLEQETAMLRSGKFKDMEATCQRKYLALLQLDQYTPERSRPYSPHLRQKVELLRDRLTQNRSIISLVMTALQEVDKLVDDCRRDLDSDGTYTLSLRKKTG